MEYVAYTILALFWISTIVANYILLKRRLMVKYNDNLLIIEKGITLFLSIVGPILFMVLVLWHLTRFVQKQNG